MEIWLAEDAAVPKPPHQRHLQAVLTNSAAAFLELSGSIAYTSESCLRLWVVDDAG